MQKLGIWTLYLTRALLYLELFLSFDLILVFFFVMFNPSDPSDPPEIEDQVLLCIYIVFFLIWAVCAFISANRLPIKQCAWNWLARISIIVIAIQSFFLFIATMHSFIVSLIFFILFIIPCVGLVFSEITMKSYKKENLSTK